MDTTAEKIAEAVSRLKKELFAFLRELVRTPSLPGGEQEAQRLFAGKLNELKLEVSLLHSNYEKLKNHPAFRDDGIPFDNRINVIGRWRSPDRRRGEGGRSLILNGHMDVVSPGGESLWHGSPWSGKISGGRMYGRGSCDMKSGLCAAVFAVQALQNLGFTPAGDVLVESVIGEESSGVGSLTTIVDGVAADAAVIMEPTGMSICPVQAGALTFRITVRGRSAHACAKHAGVSALEKFFLLYRAFGGLEKERHETFRNPLYDDSAHVAPISFGTVRCGNWHSTVPDQLVAEGRFGVFPGESIESAQWSFEETLRQAAEDDPWLRDNPPVLEWIEGVYEPVTGDPAHPAVTTLAECSKMMSGSEPRIRGVTFGSDLMLFANHAKIPAVLYGPGNILEAHTIDESVALDDVLTCTRVLAAMIVRWCGGERGF